MTDRDELREAATQAALAAWQKGAIFNSMTPDADYTRPPWDVVMARLSGAIIEVVEPLIIAAEQERLREQIIPLLRTSGINHKPQDRITEADLAYDMGLDSVLDMLGWAYGDD